jgi:hypothetical protein
LTVAVTLADWIVLIDEPSLLIIPPNLIAKANQAAGFVRCFRPGRAPAGAWRQDTADAFSG